MGASDRKGMWKVANIPQEVVCVCREVDEDSVSSMESFLREQTGGKARIVFKWNTWKGQYCTPPDDDPPWSEEEYNVIRRTLEKHPNVMMVDTSPGSGSEG